MSSTRALRRKKALNEYIDSYGENLPNDWHYYATGAEHEHECVFCTDDHVSYPVPKLDPIRNEAKYELGIYACGQCAQHVGIMLSTVYGMPEQFPETKGTDKNNRLQLLLNGLIFEPEVYKYYTHLKYDSDRYVLNYPQLCYLCDSGDVVRGIKVPVTHSTEISGGNVHICTDCEYDITELDILYQSLLVKGTIFREECPVCKSYYYIDINELDYRSDFHKESAEPTWLCPECTYVSVNAIKEDAPLYSFENALVRQNVANRFTQVLSCLSCKRPVVVDLMMSYGYIRDRHFIDEDTLICEECARKGIKAFLKDKYVVHIGENVYIKMIFAIYWDYEVIRLKKGESCMELVLTASTDEEEIAEAVNRAVNEVTKLRGGEQLKIW